MSNDYSGDYLVLDDGSVVLSSGATRLAAMTATDPSLYMVEEGVAGGTIETDCFSVCTGPNGMLVRMSRAEFALMKLNASYTFCTHTVAGERVLRLVSKTSALTCSLSQGSAQWAWSLLVGTRRTFQARVGPHLGG